MAFSRFDKDLDIIAKLSDDPNTTDGLSSNQLKAKFDQGPKTIKDWINAVFLAALEGVTAAANIGARLTGFPGITTVQQALEKLLEIANQASEASITDGSVTHPKLAVVDANGANGAVDSNNINKYAVTHEKLAVVNSSGENGAVDTNNINDGAVTSEKLAPGAVSGAALTQNSVTNEALDSGDAGATPPRPAAVSTDKIQNEAVTAPKIGPNAVSSVYSGTLTVAGWTGTEAPFVQTVTEGLSGITLTDEPIIDLVTTGVYADDIAADDAWASIYRAVTQTGGISFVAKEKPSVALNFKARCIRK